MKLTELLGCETYKEALDQVEDGSYTIADHDQHFDSDHDHGCWTERYVIEKENKFYEVLVYKFGQGDIEIDEYHNITKEVFPEIITKTIYK